MMSPVALSCPSSPSTRAPTAAAAAAAPAPAPPPPPLATPAPTNFPHAFLARFGALFGGDFRDMTFPHFTKYGTFRGVANLTLPSLPCECCMSGRAGSCYEQPWLTALWCVTFIATLGSLLIAESADHAAINRAYLNSPQCAVSPCAEPVAWQFYLQRWGVVLAIVYQAMRFVVTIDTYFASIEDRLRSMEYTVFMRAAWASCTVSMPILISSAISDAIYGYGDPHGDLTVALYWVAFAFAIVEITFFRMPFLPIHALWIVFMALCVWVATVGHYGVAHYTVVELVVDVFLFFATYSLVSAVTMSRPNGFVFDDSPYRIVSADSAGGDMSTRHP